jgi:hypothetical protein
MTKTSMIIGLATAAALSFALPAQAVEGRIGGVSTCSKTNSSKCVNGAVQNYSMGQKVQLPGGTWVDCAGDCKSKLREKTVDFWYEQMNRN